MELQLETMGYGDTQLQDMALGKKILDILEKHYPLHAWFVDVNHESGHCSIQLMYEGKDKSVRIWKYGYLLHIVKFSDAVDIEKKVMRAGGEILERYGMARRKVSENDIMDFFDKGVDDSGMVM